MKDLYGVGDAVLSDTILVHCSSKHKSNPTFNLNFGTVWSWWLLKLEIAHLACTAVSCHVRIGRLRSIISQRRKQPQGT